MKLRTLHLQTKLSLLCIVLAVAPLAASGVYFVNASNGSIVHQAQQQLDQDLKASEDRLHWHLQEEANLLVGEGAMVGALDAGAQRRYLRGLVERGSVDSAVITDAQGHVTLGVGPDGRAVRGDLGWSDLTRRSIAGQETSGLEVVAGDRLDAFGLSQAASLKVIETPNARKPPYAAETRGMLMRAAVPLTRDGRTVGTLQVAKLINNRFDLVDEVMGTLGVTCTLFLDDIRISTNVKKADGKRAIGTMVSLSVADQVLQAGKTYLGRAFVVKDWYLAGYTPLLDVSGRRIGILYVGVNEAPFTDAKRTMLWQVLAAVLLLGVLASLVGYGITRSLTRPIDSLKQAAQAIAEGDLDQTVAIDRDDELGQMARSFERMVDYLKDMAGAAQAISHGDLSVSVTPRSDRDQLGTTLEHMIRSMREVVARVRRSADSVNDSSHRISSASDRLSDTTSVQASSAEETSAAMEEMAANLKSVDQSVQHLGTKVSHIRSQSDELAAAVNETSSSISELAASVQQVASNAANANQASQAAAETATAGEEAVLSSIQEMVGLANAMGGIRETIQLLDQRSGEIGAIVEVIEDIADQTNLLALNAAIEAARAGEAGRGFAVVADEVRKLAERSAKATKEINSLILGIQRETEQAVQVTQEAVGQVEKRSEGARELGVVFVQIKEAAVRVSQLLNEVSLASDEQARASTQIVSAAEQMATINQEVTGAVGEMDALTRNVTYATGEQRQGADQVVLAVEQLSRSSQEAASATDLVTLTANDLKQQAQSLQEAVGFFKLDAERQTAGSRTLALPASRA